MEGLLLTSLGSYTWRGLFSEFYSNLPCLSDFCHKSQINMTF